MLGHSALTQVAGSSINNRTFVYEVTGLRQSEETEQNSYSIRNSGSTLIQVPFNRMNEVMQKINRMGGTIVAIHSDQSTAAAES